MLCGAQRLLELTDEFLASPHVVALTDADEPLFTTVEMLGVQDRIAERFATGLHRGRTSSQMPTSMLRSTGTRTSPGAAAARDRVVPARPPLQGAIGRAGAGKTTTVAACADA